MRKSKKYVKIGVNLFTMLALACFCIWILPEIIKFFLPFIIAFIIALISEPIVKFLEKKLKIKRKTGSAVVIVLVLAVVGALVYAVIAKLVEELIGLASVAPSIWKNVVYTLQNIELTGRMKFIYNLSPDFKVASAKIGNAIGEAIAKGLESGVNTASQMESGASFVSSIPNIIISVIMTILASYMFVADRDYLPGLLKRIIPEEMRKRWNIVTESMKKAVGGYFYAQMKIMAVVFVVLLIGFIVLKVDYAILVALLISFLDFLPFFGTGTVMIPWAIIAFLNQNYRFGAGMFITWALSQIVRQLIQPKLLSDSIGLPPIPTLFLLYIGFRLGGALGLILAVPIGMIVLNLYKAGVFSNFIFSIKLLFKDFTKIRRFSDDDLKNEGLK